MEKQLINALNWRYATKKFDPSKKLKDQQVETLLESLRLTPTSYGLQLMKVVVVENPDLRTQLVEHAYGQQQVADASHLLLICREKTVNAALIGQYIAQVATTRNIPEAALDGYKTMMENSILGMNEEQQNTWMNKQAYIALGNLMNACALLEIDACPMEGFVPAEFDRVLKLDEHHLASVLAIPVGYRSEEDANAQLTKVRRSNEDFIVRI